MANTGLNMVYAGQQIQNFDMYWSPHWIYVNEDWSHLTDFHLIVFLGNQNLDVDTKIVNLSGLVPKLFDLLYFLDHADLW